MENTTCINETNILNNNTAVDDTGCNEVSSDEAKSSWPTVDIIISSVIACIGIIANSTVIVAFINHKQFRRKIPNIFIINQSSVDLVCSIILLSINLTVRDAYHTAHKGLLGDLECGFWNSRMFLWGSLFTSSWNLVCLTVERYIELIYPIWHKVHFKMRYIYTAIVLCWIFGIGMATYAIPTSKLTDGKCFAYYSWPNDEMRTTFGIIIVVLTFFIPVLILIFCYGRIVWMLSRRINTGMTGVKVTKERINENASNSRDKENRTENNTVRKKQMADVQKDKFQIARRNTIKTLLIVGCCFIICWSQNQVYYFMYNLGYEADWNSVYFQFTVLMVFLNCTINPFIYLSKYKDYQTALKELLSCKCKEHGKNLFQNSNLDSNSTNTTL